MSSLFLPPAVARELAQRTVSFRADVMRSIEMGENRHLLELSLALQRIDPRLLLVRAREHVVPGVPMKPGYYHLLVDNGEDSSVPISVTVIEGENGEFAEPTSRVLEKLAMGDMRERRNLQRWKQIQRGEYEANANEQRRLREERRDHVRDLVNAYSRASMSMHGDWAQNQAGRRGRKKR